MLEYIVTYYDHTTEIIRGYNIIQALGTVRGFLDRIIKIERLFN
jgi:hypothetical protein